MRVEIKDYSTTTFVTGMRAYAALGVLLIHAGGAGLRALGPLGETFVGLGASGVTAFFVISGFSVAASYGSSGGYGRYLFLRFFRLAPLYYFWLLIYGLLLQRQNYWTQTLGFEKMPLDLGLHLFFLHAFLVSTANSFMGVEWSLSVEMFWYPVLPFFLWLAARGKTFWPALAGLLLMFAIQLIFSRRLREDPAFILALSWDPLTHLFSFGLGLWAYKLRPQLVGQGENQRGLRLALALLALYLLLSAWLGAFAVPPIYFTSIFTFMILLYADQDDRLCRWLFLSKPLLFFGTLSYGIYLTHPLVLHFLDVMAMPSQVLQFVLALAGSVGLACLTFVGVERPSQRWSKRIFPHVNNPQA